METNLNQLILKFQTGDYTALNEIIEIFLPTIKKLIAGENKSSFFTYRDTLITDLTLSIYNLDITKISNTKAYLNTCLKNSFLKFNASSISTISTPDKYELLNTDIYQLDFNKISEYIDILRKYLSSKELELIELRIIENRSVKDIARYYNLSESNVYKRLKKVQVKLQNNSYLKKDLINNLSNN